jgi:small subunit ribosomal protein S17
MADTQTADTKSNERTLRRVRRGVVVSDARSKTIKVVNEWSRPHPKYGKIIRRRTILHAHDEENTAQRGDMVEVMACRPLSKQKSWRLIRVITRAVDR